MNTDSAIDPRLRVLFLVGAAIGIFFMPRIWMVATAAGVLAVVWLAVGLPPRRLLRQVYKLVPFALFIVASYALTRQDATVDRWIHFHGVKINVGGATVGLLMVVRVLAVVLASQVARAGDRARGRARPRQARGCRGSRRRRSTPCSRCSAAMWRRRRRRRRRRRWWRRRWWRRRWRRRGGEKSMGGFCAGLKRSRAATSRRSSNRLHRQIARAEDHVAQGGLADERGRQVARDVAVIAGVSLTMLGIKALKVLPEHPVRARPQARHPDAALHRRVAAHAQRASARRSPGSPWAPSRSSSATALRHLRDPQAHGARALCDLIVPVVTRGRRTPGAVAWSLLGALIGVGRFATIFGVTLIVAAAARRLGASSSPASPSTRRSAYSPATSAASWSRRDATAPGRRRQRESPLAAGTEDCESEAK